MEELIAIAAVAFAAQLAVLPGEKVQFIISGLSTHYRPAVVVGAAGTAFAGWTALEIWFGTAIQGALPPAALDAVTAAMFLLFAALLVRSAPADGEPAVETDGAGAAAFETVDAPAVGEVDLSNTALGSFLPIFGLMAAGEFGDKTQLVTISLALEYGAHPGIWVGEMAAILPMSLANAYCFHRFAGAFDPRKAHFAGAGIFGFFAFDTALELAFGVSVWERVVGSVAGLVQTVPA
jgi:putative Ca2+/H+ antiporter (TMEM165/GDT1 family)